MTIITVTTTANITGKQTIMGEVANVIDTINVEEVDVVENRTLAITMHVIMMMIMMRMTTITDNSKRTLIRAITLGNVIQMTNKAIK